MVKSLSDKGEEENLRQTHVVELTKQRLSDFFVKEEGHVVHKNALVVGTLATGAIFASMLLTPDSTEAYEADHYICGDEPDNFEWCNHDEDCISGQHEDKTWWYDCV